MSVTSAIQRPSSSRSVSIQNRTSLLLAGRVAFLADTTIVGCLLLGQVVHSDGYISHNVTRGCGVETLLESQFRRQAKESPERARLGIASLAVDPLQRER